jgi:predicted HAD superfamily phosphohydrolase
MNQNKYNGWSNYETWNCKLWLDNDQSNDENIKNHIDHLRVKSNLTKNDLVYKLSQYLEHLINMETPELKASMYSDILSASLREINYYEIAESFYDDLWTWVDDAQKNKNQESA